MTFRSLEKNMDKLGGANFRQPTGVDVNVDTDATDYTPQTALLRGWKKLIGGKQSTPIGTDQTDDRIPIDATRVYSVVNDGTSTDAAPFKVDLEESF